MAAVARRFNSGRSQVKALDAQRAGRFPSRGPRSATATWWGGVRQDSVHSWENGGRTVWWQVSRWNRRCGEGVVVSHGNEQVGGHTSKHPCTETAMKSGVAAALGLYTAVCNWLERSLFCSRCVASGVTEGVRIAAIVCCGLSRRLQSCSCRWRARWRLTKFD